MFTDEEVRETIDLLIEMAKESTEVGDVENAQFYKERAFKIAEANLLITKTNQ